MAQPIFDDHPLRDYLRQSGDVFEHIPGALSDISDPVDDDVGDPDYDLRLRSWLPAHALRLAKCLNIVVTSVQDEQSTIQGFSERFKYDVISSSLLSSSIASASTRRCSSSIHEDTLSDDPDPNLTTRSRSRHHVAHHNHPRVLVQFCLCLLSLVFDCFLLYVLTATVLYSFESYIIASGHQPDFISPTISALNDLIAAARLWDSAVYEAIDLLELEESIAPSSPPSSPLRVALCSALQSTQTQSDNVRHVLVGLTSPSSVAQLSEMYAPPSPMKPHIPLRARSDSATAASRVAAISTPMSAKRATWNGSIPFSYAALADAGSPSRQSLKRWEKRRSEVSALLLRPSGTIMSAPTTPRRGMSLQGVEEENINPLNLSNLSEQEVDADAVVPPDERGEFASAALKLQRQRRNRGIEALLPSTLSPPPKYTPINPQPQFSTHITRFGNKSSYFTPTSPRTPHSASRFTAMQIPRHPLSLHSLTLALNGALAARRYAASHLLALRFESGGALDDNEIGNESYWEDVRAVMALLTSALANATAPLIEALDAVERERLRTGNPTPSTSHSRSSSFDSPSVQTEQQRRQSYRSSSHLTSFAPLPSHLARFAAHVDAIMTALSDAREHLESCVASLRKDNTATVNAAATLRDPLHDPDAPALHAYECLRRELGLALRECERGREPLLELLRPPPADEDEDGEDEEDWVPALESSDSDLDVAHARSSMRATSPVLMPEQQQHDEGDDATHTRDQEHGDDVLVVGLERLPPPGIEQVFEADADAGMDDAAHRLARPRSKISRAERIAAAKARRANTVMSGLGLSVIADGDDAFAGAGEKQWGGPGGDVVQELKDVIWKVGEQRRLREKMHLQREDEDVAGQERLQGQKQEQPQVVGEASPAVIAAADDDPIMRGKGEGGLATAEVVFASPPSPPPSVPATVIT